MLEGKVTPNRHLAVDVKCCQNGFIFSVVLNLGIQIFHGSACVSAIRVVVYLGIAKWFLCIVGYRECLTDMAMGISKPPLTQICFGT